MSDAVSSSWIRAALVGVLVVGFSLRASFCLPGGWKEPYAMHHGDEHMLPLEALAWWEGVSPAEIGWPASTTRILLGSVYAVAMVGTTPAVLPIGGQSVTGALDTFTDWTRAQWQDPSGLIRIGRWVSVITGVLQVLVMDRALHRWEYRASALAAAGMCAIPPLLVVYRQFELADITGLVFCTALVGLLAPSAARRVITMGVLVGLASASKYHFSLWIVPCLLTLWMDDAAPAWAITRQRIRAIATCAAAALIVHLLFVPWILTATVLWAKEVLNVAVFKVRAPAGAGGFHVASNLRIVFGAVGPLMLAGLIPAALLVWRNPRRFVPILSVLVLGTALVGVSQTVFDRYAIFVVPALVLLSAEGYALVFTEMRRPVRWIGGVATAILLIITVSEVRSTQRFYGAVDSYRRSQTWILTHLQPGARVAVESEYGPWLPRTREQLITLIRDIGEHAAYVRKMEVNGIHFTSASEPMRLAVLNDEHYFAHWYRRELSGRLPGNGFEVTYYSDEPRFKAIETSKAIAEFVAGLGDRARGFDALLLNKRAVLPISPAVEFKGQPGETLFLYLRQ